MSKIMKIEITPIENNKDLSFQLLRRLAQVGKYNPIKLNPRANFYQNTKFRKRKSFCNSEI